jgi:allantoate deiminase
MDQQGARTVLDRIEILAGFSEEQDRLTRRFASEAMRQANEAAGDWMRAAGMAVRQDAIGNLIGYYKASRVGAKTLILGSHLDTVRDAGKYDGALGVLVALACVERLHARKELLPFGIEIIGFADEEGLRYHTTYLGSRVVAGCFDPIFLTLEDGDGIPMARAIRAFGGNPDALQTEQRPAGDLLGYCEVHIEQGPVLEAENLPLGVVSAIAGQSRIAASFAGEAGHAGTLPMNLRRDALCAAAEFIIEVESVARNRLGLVATVGRIAAEPGAPNVVPGQVTLSLDVRHQDDRLREDAVRRLREQAEGICSRRRISLGWRILQEDGAVPCAPSLSGKFAQAIEALGHKPFYLPSGAGHDAVPLAGLTQVAMLFVRCKGGISHNPAESVKLEDVALAIAALEKFLKLLAGEVH